MIIYNVTVSIDKDIEIRWLEWMKKTHIPDVMRTGKFLDCKISRVLSNNKDEYTYAIAYTCKNMNDYNNYQQNFANKLKKEHTKKFPGKFAAFRTLLEVVYIHE
jgi:hypothetical protein